MDAGHADLLKSYEGTRVAITGAGGFVGSHLAQTLQELGARVVALDVVNPSERLDDFSGGIEYVPFDLLRVDAAKAAIRDVSPELLFHLAAYAVQPRERDAQIAISINVAGSAAVIEGAAEGDVKGIVQVGTSHEYGGDDQPIDESHSLDPTGIYGATKAAAMIVGRARAREIGVRWLGVRPFVTFGPREDEDKLVPYIITRALRGEPVLTTDGSQNRDVLYVRDMVRAMALLAAADVPTGACVNIGSGRWTSLRAIMESIRELIPTGDYRFGARKARVDDIKSQIANNARLRKFLPGWVPEYSLRKALVETIHYYARKFAKGKGPSQN